MSAAHLAIALILLSAITHAIIGAMMKREEDRLNFRGMIGGISALIIVPALFVLPIPPAEIWVWLLLGCVLHLTYQISQIAAYDRGDMSIVYPLMRGSAPALAAIFAYLILRETIKPIEAAGLGIAVLALIGFGWPTRKALATSKLTSAIGFALLCGMLTALYTVIDAKGIRLSGMKLSYIAWFFLIDGIGIWIIIMILRGEAAFKNLRTRWHVGVLAAALSVVCYGAALLAFSMAPIAGLAALRETSIVFGAVLATIWLKEAFGGRRIVLAILLAFGLILMQLA